VKQEGGPGHDWDVAIVGGALSGAATAILLLRANPRLRIVILEKSEVFSRRVGEATVEVSGYFLGRVLGLTDHLNQAHLVKQGMRFWFANAETRSLEDCSEIGGRYQVRLPAYQVDRSVLDEEVLRRACVLGATLRRPAKVTDIKLQPGGMQTIMARTQDQTESICARWVVDASGFAALLSRQEGWFQPNNEHPTTAVWSRWRGVQDWDSYELAQKFPNWARACHGNRNTATNHLTGDGWWAWWIPLKGGDVSIGVVFDQRLVSWPKEGPLGNRLKQFLARHPVGQELLDGAQWLEGDVHWRQNLPYSSSVYAGDGFVLVGDAGAFLDPLYSPGMDWLSYTVTSAAQLILTQQKDEDLGPRLAKHNRDFARSYARWFEAIYKDKYEYLGEFDLMRLAFLLDLGLYYLGIVSQPFKRGSQALTEPVFATKPSVPFYHLMRTYNRRLAEIARTRRSRRVLGQFNCHHRFLFNGYSLEPGSAKPVLRALLEWTWLEIREGWRTWGSTRSPRGRVKLLPLQPAPDKLPQPAR
jgi:flavin-dependent dehydrogenase